MPGRSALSASRVASLTPLAAAAVLVAAPPGHPALWGIDGFRSVTPATRLGIVLFALAAAAAPRVLRATWARFTATAALAVALAWPMREAIHWLGDTGFRLRAIASPQQPGARWDDFRRVLHAAPLDALIGYSLPQALVHNLHVGPQDAVSIVCTVLAVLALAGAWRLVRSLGWDGREAAAGAFLLMAGTLGTFAGYAESAAPFVTGIVWWLPDVLIPPRHAGHVVRVLAGWVLLTQMHRMGLLLAPLVLLWAMAPREDAGAPGVPAVLGGAAVALGLALVANVAFGLGRLEGDLHDWVAGGLRLVGARDTLELLAVTCPLAFVAPALFARAPDRSAARTAIAVLAAAAALLAVALVQPLAPSGLGPQRDWDLAVAGGLLLATAILVLARGARDGARGWPLPAVVAVVALQAASWVAVDASASASVDRAVTLAYAPAALPAAQRSHVFMFLGDRAMALGEPATAGSFYEAAWTLLRSPRRAIAAARAWADAGDPPRARAMLRAARSTGLTPDLADAADQISAAIDTLPAPTPPPAGPHR